MKIASGAARPASAAGARPPRPRAPARRSAAALRRMRAARSARASIAIARIDGIGQHPFDRDRARAGADVPEQFAAARRQRRQRHRADLALGDLAVMLEQIVGEPGARAMTRASGAASTSIATVLSAIDVAEVESLGGRRADPLARPAERFQHGHARGAEARSPRAAAPMPPAPRRRRSAPGCARRAADAAG